MMMMIIMPAASFGQKETVMFAGPMEDLGITRLKFKNIVNNYKIYFIIIINILSYLKVPIQLHHLILFL